ncbi:sodium-dependent transporter [Chondrinema litorale]|uniref:sodium-dependent transporter n=1 Tax=Chondrinema litorale TaxID=2994555 RepID=UPI002542BCEB|nr:sodium-dependent transporter [Chondrinema litorale]UZR99418.1 sodium-dependent transporter [Chondrinema litorale]
MDKSIHQRFSSKTAFLLSVLGIAIGTGNIWRFPRIVAQNGSENGAGAFIFAWVIFLLTWSIPLIISEYAIGRKFRMGLIGAMKGATNGKLTWMGAFMAFVATAITFFYSVVVGWCIYYFFYMMSHSLPENTETAMFIWNSYQDSYWPLATHTLALVVGCLAIWKGVSSIEKVNKVLIPSLLVILILCIIRALTLDGALEGINYLFTPDWAQLSNPKIWVEALTQNAWDTGAGWGLFITYAAYMKSEQGIVKNAFFTGIGNNCISLISAIVIFGTVFAILKNDMGMSETQLLEVVKTSGPASTGLTFIWMPQLFAKMFGGNVLAILFFMGLTFAGFSSLIAQLELPARVFVDFGFSRSKALLIIGIASYAFGIPSAISLDILGNQDFVWGVALILSGVFFSIVLIKYGLDKLREDENQQQNDDWKIKPVWKIIMNYLVPPIGTGLVIWFLIDAAKVDKWYDPFKSYSLMTCLFQFAIAISLFMLLNKKLNKHVKEDTKKQEAVESI